jgi:hypothetical protein
VEKYDTAGQATDENITRSVRFPCWTNEATNTHSEYVILIDFPWQQWLRESSSMLLRKYIARLNIYPIRKICVLNGTNGILLNFYSFFVFTVLFRYCETSKTRSKRCSQIYQLLAMATRESRSN